MNPMILTTHNIIKILLQKKFWSKFILKYACVLLIEMDVVCYNQLRATLADLVNRPEL
jgi:hypothetical protein